MDVKVHASNLKLQEFVNKHLIVPYQIPMGLRILPFRNYLQMYIKDSMTHPSLSELKQEHKVFSLVDGGQCCCTIFYPPGQHKEDEKTRDKTHHETHHEPDAKASNKNPIIFIFPTLTGNSEFFSCFILYLTKIKGWTAIVLHKRGQHCPLLNYKFHPTGSDHDTHIMVQWTLERFRGHKAFTYGVSAGAIMMSRYLGKYQPAEILAAVGVSGAFEWETVEQLDPFLHSRMKQKIYSTYPLPEPKTEEEVKIGKELKVWVETKDKNITELFLIFNPTASRAIVDREVGIQPALPHIKSPILFINSKDDPMFPGGKTFEHLNKNAIFVQSEEGSHACYFESAWTWAQLSWVETKAFQFFEHHF